MFAGLVALAPTEEKSWMADKTNQNSPPTMAIVLESEAPQHDVDAVQDVVSDIGISATVKPTFLRKSAGELPWVICLLTPVWVFFAAFLAAAGQEAGREAYQLMRRFIVQLYQARRSANGSITLRHPETHSQISLEPDLPDEAYRQLTQMGPELLEGHHWTWDYDQNQWTKW